MGNFSRDTFDRLKHYVGVRLQQGVPIIDADWNEAFDIRKYELQAFLKWFVGNGVPQDNDGFRILPAHKADNDFVIQGRAGTADGQGRCLVEGWDVVIERDRRYTEQPLYDNEVLAEDWGVDKVPPLTSPDFDRTDTVYLDVWEREVDADEDSDLVNPAIGLETCVRLKREWVVRVAEGEEKTPKPPDGHVFYPLATLDRTADQAAIPADAITDLRRTGLAVLSKEITIKDGNVGIGTTDPGAKLVVREDPKIGRALEVYGDTYLVGPLSVSGETTLTDGFTVTGGDTSLDGALTVGGKLSFDTPPMRMERFKLGRLSAIDLDGVNDYVQIDEAVWFDGGPFTIEGWVFLRTFANNCRLIDFGNGPSMDNIVAHFNLQEGKFMLAIVHAGVVRQSGSTPRDIDMSRWVHVAATFVPSLTIAPSLAKLYLDGALVLTHGFVPPVVPRDVERTKNYIGKSNYGSDANTNGYIDEVRIWNRALSEDEILAYMHRRVNGDEEGLVACWDFEGEKVNNRVPDGLGGQVMGEPKNALRIPHYYDTGYPVKDWVAISASYVEAAAPEAGGGEHLLLVQLDGKWFIRSEVRPDRKTQLEVDVLFMPRGWVTGPE